MIPYILLILVYHLTPGYQASHVVLRPVSTTPDSLRPLAIKELENRHLPWDQFLGDDNIQKTKIFEETRFRSSGFGEGAYVVGPPKRIVYGNNDTYRNTPIVPLKENYMNCSFRKKNPVAYDEALYPFEMIDQRPGKTVLVVCDNSAHGTNMCEFLRALYNAHSAHCTCPHVMDGYANVGFCTLRYRDGKEMSYCNTPAHNPMWLLRLCAYKIPMPVG
ncbi:uncharacterized protein LOC103509057 [Diaphorina citri]|uniref:Uncharacterized protein LOC103509057 n=1 Tax=Diaphorina citri TaxID=121845 RepID=A0A1S3D0Z4_DIACI|nr:uncharacterized protein LOC103509057 [Diaphorina citri]